MATIEKFTAVIGQPYQINKLSWYLMQKDENTFESVKAFKQKFIFRIMTGKCEDYHEAFDCLFEPITIESYNRIKMLVLSKLNNI